MNKRVVKAFSMAAAVSMLLSLAACGGAKEAQTADTGKAVETQKAEDTQKAESQSTEKVKLKIYTQYTDDTEKLPYDYAKAAMEKIMPNVELELEVEAQDDNQKLKTYAASGNLPDIFRVTSDTRETLKKSDNLLVLDKYIQELKVEDQLVPTAIPLIKDTDGHYYSIMSMGTFSELIYYNKDIFQSCGAKIPTNFDEFLDAVKLIKAKGIVPMAVFAKEKWPGVQLFDLCTVGAEPSGNAGLDQGKSKITDPVYKSAAEKVIALSKAGTFDKNLFNTPSDQALAMFAEGKAAMFINGAWALGDVGGKLGDKADFMYPNVLADAGSSWDYNASGGGFNGGLAVSANSENKDLAAQFAIQLGLKTTEGRTVKLLEPNTVLKDCAAPEKEMDAIQKKYSEEAPKFKTFSSFPWGITNAKLKTLLEDNCQKLLTGQISADQFINEVSKGN